MERNCEANVHEHHHRFPVQRIFHRHRRRDIRIMEYIPYVWCDGNEFGRSRTKIHEVKAQTLDVSQFYKAVVNLH